MIMQYHKFEQKKKVIFLLSGWNDAIVNNDLNLWDILLLLA